MKLVVSVAGAEPFGELERGPGVALGVERDEPVSGLEGMVVGGFIPSFGSFGRSVRILLRGPLDVEIARAMMIADWIGLYLGRQDEPPLLERCRVRNAIRIPVAKRPGDCDGTSRRAGVWRDARAALARRRWDRRARPSKMKG